MYRCTTLFSIYRKLCDDSRPQVLVRALGKKNDHRKLLMLRPQIAYPHAQWCVHTGDHLSIIGSLRHAHTAITCARTEEEASFPSWYCCTSRDSQVVIFLFLHRDPTHRAVKCDHTNAPAPRRYRYRGDALLTLRAHTQVLLERVELHGHSKQERCRALTPSWTCLGHGGALKCDLSYCLQCDA